MSHPKLQDHIARLFPGATLLATEPLGPDVGATASSNAKALGYTPHRESSLAACPSLKHAPCRGQPVAHPGRARLARSRANLREGFGTSLAVRRA